MEGIRKIIRSTAQLKPNKHLHSDVHALTDEISSYFGERRRFGMYLGVIQRVGTARARTIFSEVKTSDADNPRKLFFWKCRKPQPVPAPGAEDAFTKQTENAKLP